MGATTMSRRAFLLRKLHSLSGVLPVGVFLLEHLWTNGKVLAGQQSFETAVLRIQALPLLPVIEVVGIFVPLAFHALFGAYIAWAGQPNVLRYNYPRNWLYSLQRASGVVALTFIAWHLYEYRLQKWLFGMQPESFYDVLTAHLSSTVWGVPLLALVYMIGVGATIFHFANGLWGFCASWGLTVTRRAQRRAGWAFATLGVLLFALGADTVIYLATGSRMGLPGEYVPFKGEIPGAPCPGRQP